MSALRAEEAELDTPHCRTYKIGGLTVDVRSDLPFAEHTFQPHIEQFRIGEPGQQGISIHHHFRLPDLGAQDVGKCVVRQTPWVIYHGAETWTYLGITPWSDESAPYMVATFDETHARGDIYHATANRFLAGDAHSLSFFPTDQILLARVFADWQACYFHAAGLSLGGQGVAFIGHSEAGKSTTATMLEPDGQLLCDERIIVRQWPEGFRVHGSWSHGDVPTVSPDSAPLRALFLLEQSKHNRAFRLSPQDVVRALPLYVVRPLLTNDWWAKTLDLIGAIARHVPTYRLQLDKSGAVRQTVRQVLQETGDGAR